jgi:hypothetical protein
MEPVNEIERTHHRHGGPHPDNFEEGHRPYWTRAHRDWRIWVALLFCMAAIVIYVLSDDLAFMPSGRPRHAVSRAVAR